LHEATRGLPLDFFVLYSSIASVLGSPGQGNYAAANAFLDALAHTRRAEGLPTCSINWGPWAAVGMAAALGDRDQRRREEQGIALIEPSEGLRALESVLGRSEPQYAVLPVDWSGFFRQFASGGVPPVLREMEKTRRSVGGASARVASEPAGNFLKTLEATPEGERAERVLAHVREQVVRVLGLDASRPPSLKEGLTDMGMDSLMAVELRNRLEASLGRPLPATLAYEHPTLARLSAFLCTEVLALKPVAARDAEEERRRAEVQDLSKDQLEASLLSELERAGY
jgi:acyl carrier protein